ncbi:MAG TPA: glycoside hydrolase family 2 TIM barrel-domain containing protein [Thermoanaerobaculia bacterium]|nr:glycoside hydrolase family 2 TIM barrel-domain containing protein [Thermoanaerobaculia bacterium]
MNSRTTLVIALLATLPIPALASPRVRHTINEGWTYTDGTVEQRVNLPHTWNAGDAFGKTKPYRRGIGWYRRTLSLDPALKGKRLFLYFEGANQVADVYVNDRHAGQHIGGYTAFAFEITDLVTFERDAIAVRVDNSHDPDIPPLNADFTFFGGIYRDVWLMATDPIHIDVLDHASPGVFITKDRTRGTVVNRSGRSARVRVVHRIFDAAGREVASSSSALSIAAGASARFDGRTPAVPDPRLWSPDSPYLYRVRTEVHGGDRLLDAIDNPLGFRTFTADPNKGLTLNGRLLPLRGTNRHQDLPGVGTAASNEQHRRDVRLVKENGFNFLRLAHYPQDPVVLDEADRVGLVIWEEIPIVNLIGTSPAFAANSERMLVEMIRQHFNHPSVFFWGYMNEVLLSKPNPMPDRYYEIVPELVRRLEKVARAEDPTRLTVMALSYHEILDDHGIASVPHILGLNLYFGWYYDDFDAFGPFLDRIHAERPATPIIVSEYGADSDERVHSTEPKAFDYSSEHAQNYHVASFPQLESRPFILGTAVWNQFDFASAFRQNTKVALNQKGLYFHDRTPKDIAFYYRASLTGQPVLHIASEWSDRAGRTAEERVQPVWVYSNQPEVELFVNGRSAGVRQVANRTARWNVELASGANRLRARAGSIEDATTIRYHDRSDGRFVAVNAGGGYSYVDEARVVWDADHSFGGGKPRRVYRRIVSTGHDALFQAMREGMSHYQFDVPDGIYDVTLGFAEHDAKPGERVFSVRINGRLLVRDLDLAAELGPFTAATRSTTVEAANGSGIRIDFTASHGLPSIATIMIRP